MKEIKHHEETSSYMQLCMYVDGKSNIYLMIPIIRDPVNDIFLGYVKTPITNRLIYATGKNSRELEANFFVELNKCIEGIPEETLSMFKPLEYWESRL